MRNNNWCTLDAVRCRENGESLMVKLSSCPAYSSEKLTTSWCSVGAAAQERVLSRATYPQQENKKKLSHVIKSYSVHQVWIFNRFSVLFTHERIRILDVETVCITKRMPFTDLKPYSSIIIKSGIRYWIKNYLK